MASYDINQGILGLEGRHQWRAFEGGPVLRGQHARSSTWWGKLDEIVGLHSAADFDPQNVEAESRMGLVPLPTLQRGRTIVYTGRLVGRSLPQLRLAGTAMRRWFAGKRDGSMTVTPHPSWGDPGAGFYYQGRVLQYDSDDKQERGRNAQPTPWQRDFTLGIQMLDPRYLWSVKRSVTGKGRVVCPVRGNAPTSAAKVTIRGVGGNLTIRNMTTGRQLAFAGLPSAQRIFVNFAQRAGGRPSLPEPHDSPNANVLQHLLFESSDWLDADTETDRPDGVKVCALAPGSNEIRVAGSHSSFTVEWFDACW